MNEETKPVLFSCGIISDVQYADAENGTDFSKTRTRFYRTSLGSVKDAVNDWLQWPHPISFVLQLGDIIDGLNNRLGSGASDKALNAVIKEFEQIQKPVYHVWGNHDLYNYSRKQLLKSVLNTSLECNAEDSCRTANYYHFSPYEGFRVVALDMYEVSSLGYKDDTNNENFLEAESLLNAKNKNSDHNSPLGLRGTDSRFCMFNGGVSETQLKWLDRVLENSDKNSEKVILIGHCGIYEESVAYICLAWNYRDILTTVHKHRCVVTVICGHDHDGGYAVDDHGIHHFTLPGVIETRGKCHGVLDVRQDSMILQWQGQCPFPARNIDVSF